MPMSTARQPNAMPPTIGGDCARKELLSVSEAADALGLRPSAIRAWIYRRRIPYVHVGRAVRISAFEVERIISAGSVPALRGREVGR